MRRLLASVVLVGVLGACSSSDEPPAASPAPSVTTTPSSAVQTTAAVPAVQGLEIQVNELDVNKSNIYIAIEVKNASTQAQQFDWPKLVLTGPDGSTRTVYRDPGAAKSQTVAGGGFLLEGGYFRYDRFRPGRYSVAYDGQVIETKTL